MDLSIWIFMPPTLETFQNIIDSIENDIEKHGPLHRRYLDYIKRPSTYPSLLKIQIPESNKYFHLLNPSFTLMPTNINNIYPVCLLRDGFIPLVNFFSTKSFHHNNFLVHEDLAFIIPPEQKQKFYLYNVIVNKKGPLKRNKVLVTGVINGASFSLEYFKKKMRQVDRALKKKSLSWNCVYFLFFIRDNLFFSVDTKKVDPLALYMKELNKYTKGKGHFLASDALSYIHDFSDWFYICLHENSILIADNYLEHLFLSKGGSPLITKKIKSSKYSVTIPISPYHSYLIKNFSYKKNESRFKEIKKMFQFFSAGQEMAYGSFFFYAREILSKTL